MAVDGLHELFDGLARGIGGGTEPDGLAVQHALDELAASRGRAGAIRVGARSALNGAGKDSRLVKMSRVSPFALSRAQTWRIASSSRCDSSESASAFLPP